jgi:hypothetical protein
VVDSMKGDRSAVLSDVGLLLTWVGG